jgi:trehalose 6-phosphate synthase
MFTISSGLRFAGTTLELDGRQILTGTFPIGIEPSEFHSRVKKDGVQEMIRSMRDKFDEATVIVGVDRLDYIKGVPQKLRAFDMFLERHPEWVGKTVLVQVAIPSRANLEVNQKLRVDVQNLIGEINGKYGMRYRFVCSRPCIFMVRVLPQILLLGCTQQQA